MQFKSEYGKVEGCLYELPPSYFLKVNEVAPSLVGGGGA